MSLAVIRLLIMDKYEIISNSHFTELEASEYLENQVKSLNNVVNSEMEVWVKIEF